MRTPLLLVGCVLLGLAACEPTANPPDGGASGGGSATGGGTASGGGSGEDAGAGGGDTGGGGGGEADGGTATGGGGGSDGGISVTCIRGGLSSGFSAPGSCGFSQVAATMPPIYASMKLLSVSTPFMMSGDPRTGADGCGQCFEITRGGVTAIGLVVDFCDPGVGVMCGAKVPSMSATANLSSELGLSGSDVATFRPVACPTPGTMRAWVDPTTNTGYVSVRVYSHRVGLRNVEARGAGPGVAADNPWTPLSRQLNNLWTRTGSELRRGGTGVQLRLTSAHGQVIEAPPGVALTAMNDVDLGVQFDDWSTPGPVCSWQPVRDVYADALGSADFSGWSAARWLSSPFNATSNADWAVDCRTAKCLLVSAAGFGGTVLVYSGLLPVEAAPTLELWVRTPAGTASLSVRGAPGCTEVPFTATTTWTRVTVDLSAACPAGTNVNRLQFQSLSNMPLDFALDDVRLLAP